MNLFQFFMCLVSMWLPLADLDKSSKVFCLKHDKNPSFFSVVKNTKNVYENKTMCNCLKHFTNYPGVPKNKLSKVLASGSKVLQAPKVSHKQTVKNEQHLEKSAETNHKNNSVINNGVEKNVHEKAISLGNYYSNAVANSNNNDGILYKRHINKSNEGNKNKKLRKRNINEKEEKSHDERTVKKTQENQLKNFPFMFVLTKNEKDILKEASTKEEANQDKEEEETTQASIEHQEGEETSQNMESNVTDVLGSYLGAPCETICSEKLVHVFCDSEKGICECENKYPVQIGIDKGCEKPKQLGDQCFYDETCSFFDANAECAQIDHNAICQCKPGYHSVALRKGFRKMFCSEDVVVVSADLPKLLGVATGIAVLTGLLCFVLRLFSSNRYPATRHYGNANLAPPLLFSSDNQWINGIPLTVQGRSSVRSSYQKSTASLAQCSRKKGIPVPASRAGAARAAAILLIPCHLESSKYSESEVENEDGRGNAIEMFSRIDSRRHSLTSIHSTTSSLKSMSFSARRFERENQQREQKAALKAAKEETAKLAMATTPSPISNEDVLLIDDPVSTTSKEEDFHCSDQMNSAAQINSSNFLCQKGDSVEESSTPRLTLANY